MARRLSEKDKKFIINSFSEGKTINELSKKFECTNLTIIRNLKKNLGERRYKELSNQIKNNDKSIKIKKSLEVTSEDSAQFSQENTFTEIIPLNYDIENSVQKDLSSVQITDIDFPNVVFMVVDNKIELDIKYLKDYPDWQFLSKEELNRKTIEIFNDLKTAKRFCNKEQKVIKVPNTEVFRIVAPILLSRGISRIVNAEKINSPLKVLLIIIIIIYCKQPSC